MTIDTFDRADGGLGANWTTNAGSILIASNEAKGNDAGFSLAYYNAASFTNDHASIVVMGAHPGGGGRGQGAAVRASTSGAHTCYRAIVINGGVLLNRVVAGVSTSLGSSSGWASGDELAIEAVGTAIRVYQNQSLVISATDATITTGAPGIVFWGTDDTIASWEGLAGGMPAPPADPTGLTATPDPVRQEVIALAWADNSSDEDSFKVERSLTGSGGWSVVATVAANTTSYEDSAPAYDTLYYYRVRAYSAAGGYSGYTGVASARTSLAPAWPDLQWQIAFDSDSVKDFVQSDLATAATWTDVTAYVERWGHSYGRQRQLQRAEAGTGWLELDDSDGRFDPENASSPYGADGSWARPGKHVRLRATYDSTTYDVLYMFTEAWEPRDLSRAGHPSVRVRLSDAVAWLARATASVATASALSGAAIGELLTDTGVVTALQNLDAGARSVTAVSETGNAWSIAQSMADGEEGAVLYVDGAGRYTYHDHTHRYARERSIVLQAIFDNDPDAQASGALPFTGAAYARDATDLYTQASVSRSGGSTQNVTSSTLANRYHNRTLGRSTRNVSDGVAQDLAARLVYRSLALWDDHGMAQHTALTVEAGAGPAAIWPAVLGLTISDQIEVTERLWPGGRTRTIRSYVEGATVDVDMARGSWRVTYRLSRALDQFHWSIRGKGVAFPLNPTSGDLYFRTDLNLLCVYDGTRWLTAHEYHASTTSFTSMPISVAPAALAVVAVTGAYSLYVTRVIIASYVATTNSGSHYWSMSLAIPSGATLATTTTAAQAADAFARYDVAINAVHAPGSVLQLNASAKTGSPGPLYAYAAVMYRLVIT